MDLSDLPRDVLDNYYRFSVLGHFNPVTAEDGKVFDIVDQKGTGVVAYGQQDGLYAVKMRMPPDGREEYWQQTDAVYDAASGFKAMMFVRCEEDGSIYLDDNRQPSYMAALPGNTNTEIDLAKSRGIVYGEDMDEYVAATAKFVQKCGEGMMARSVAGNHGLGTVVCAHHSLGANSINAGVAFQGEQADHVETIMYEPVGAVKALREYAQNQAKITHNTEDPTLEQSLVFAEPVNDLVRLSVRSKDHNVMQNPGSFRHDANDMIGPQAAYLTREVRGPLDDLEDHGLASLGNSIWRHDQAAIKTVAEATPVESFLKEGERLTEDEMAFARNNADIFQMLGMRNGFNEAAAHELHAQEFKPYDFSKLDLPEPALEKEAVIEAQNTVEAESSGSALSFLQKLGG